jgi:hypothetical protein
MILACWLGGYARMFAKSRIGGEARAAQDFGSLSRQVLVEPECHAVSSVGRSMEPSRLILPIGQSDIDVLGSDRRIARKDRGPWNTGRNIVEDAETMACVPRTHAFP